MSGSAGAREVTLLGQTVNSYRHEQAGFADLLRAVAGVPGIERVRFTSPYPIDFSDEVLRRMKRGYDVADFRAIVAALRAAAPGIAITTDILVGFSGETDEDHQ